MDKICTIYLVRHGQSLANITGVMGGDEPLSDLGREQALNLGKKLKNVDFSVVFSSDKLRARQTAELIIKGKNLEIQTHKGLKERSFGSLDKETNKEYMHLFNALNDMTDDEVWKWKIIDDMETAEEAVGRFYKAVREIAAAYLGKKVLIVAHGTVNRSFLVKIGFGTFANLQNGAFTNTAYAIIDFDGENFKVKETFGVNIKNK